MNFSIQSSINHLLRSLYRYLNEFLSKLSNCFFALRSDFCTRPGDDSLCIEPCLLSSFFPESLPNLRRLVYQVLPLLARLRGFTFVEYADANVVASVEKKP